jgi:hypothetical protein
MDDHRSDEDLIREWQQDALRRLKAHIDDLNSIATEGVLLHNNDQDIGVAEERLRRWDQRAHADVKTMAGHDEAARFWSIISPWFHLADPFKNFANAYNQRHQFLGVLVEEIEDRPEHVHANRARAAANAAASTASPSPPAAELAIAHVQRIFDRFPRVARQLGNRRAPNNAPKDPLKIENEYDVQYILGALLALYFDDIRPEDSVPTHAGQATRIDFVLPEVEIGIEVKMARKGLTERKLSDELILDIERYPIHEKVKTLAIFIYDPDYAITNPDSVKNDLERKREGLDVRVHFAR